MVHATISEDITMKKIALVFTFILVFIGSALASEGVQHSQAVSASRTDKATYLAADVAMEARDGGSSQGRVRSVNAERSQEGVSVGMTANASAPRSISQSDSLGASSGKSFAQNTASSSRMMTASTAKSSAIAKQVQVVLTERRCLSRSGVAYEETCMVTTRTLKPHEVEQYQDSFSVN
jgi:hypothetical protein